MSCYLCLKNNKDTKAVTVANGTALCREHALSTSIQGLGGG